MCLLPSNQIFETLCHNITIGFNFYNFINFYNF